MPANKGSFSNKTGRSEGFTISRRAFLGISAGAAAAAAAAYAIKWPGAELSPAPEGYVEGLGEERWVATSCLNCPTRCAVNARVVRTRNDNTWRAVRIVGNNKSTYSEGKTCPRSHVGLQALYNPERITTPLERTSQQKGADVDPGWEPIGGGWAAALETIEARLTASPSRVLFLQGLNATSDEDLISRFAKALGTVNLLTQDSLEIDADQTGKYWADGRRDSGYDLENANYVLAFGANIVESERPLARNLRMWGKIRRERPIRAKVIVIDPRYSVTAAKADEWIPVNPGTEGALAMAMANVIISEDLYDQDFKDNWTTGFNDFRDVALGNDFSPESVADITGVSADVIRRIAREFASAKPAIAWSGTGATSWPHGAYASHAIYCLNALVGSINVAGGVIYQGTPPYRSMPAVAGTDPGISLKQAAELLANGNVDTVVGFGSNLIMSAPETGKWNEYLKDVFYVHIGPSWNEMAKYADIVLPACTYLEEWAYETALPGSGYAEARIKQPVVDPPAESKPVAQILFDLADTIGGTVSDAFQGIGDDPQGFVQFRTGTFISWQEFQTDGVWKEPDYQPPDNSEAFNTASGRFEFQSTNLDELLQVEFQGSESEYPLILTTYDPVLNIRDGNQNYPWAQEMFLVMHGRGWDNFVEINSETAHEFKINDGDMVWVESAFGQIKARARVFEGILPGVVAIAGGQGHHSCGEWADGIGVNPNAVIALDYDDSSGQPCYLNTRVNIRKA